jgi:DNA-binding PadR family transcriptional regulator
MPATAAATAAASEHLPLAPLDYLVLVVLADGPLHGYGLAREIGQRSDGVVEVRPGNLYRVLDRLLRRDLVAEATQEGGDGAADGTESTRRDYRITGLGRSVLAAEERMRHRIAAASAGLRKLTEPA